MGRVADLVEQMSTTAPMYDDPPEVAEITAYDRIHFAEYLSLLYAQAEGLTDAEMARDICGIDPVAEPVRAKRVLAARLARARWFATHGQQLLLEEGLSAKAPEGHRRRLR